MNVVARPTTGSEDETQEFEFSMIDQADYSGIDAYIKRHGLQDASLAEARRAKKYQGNGTKTDQRGEGAVKVEEVEEESELQKAERELEDLEDEEEDDYDPGSDGDSDGSGTSSEDEEDDGEGEHEEDEEGDLVADELGSEAEEVAADEQ